MVEYTVDIEGGMAETMENNLPDGVTAEDWMALQVEQGIAQEQIQSRQEEIQQKAQLAAQQSEGE